MSEELKKEWEKEFEKKFFYDIERYEKYTGLNIEKELKSFISSLLTKQQEEFVKMVEAVCAELYLTGNEPRSLDFREIEEYNQALADIKSKLNI